MTVLHPEFLWGFLALLIPIIVHLFHFRRFKKVDFSNVRFLKNIEKQQENKRKLKYYLILASRLLAITFLVLAFAIPLKKKDAKSGEKETKHISVFIDNSLSMASTSADGIHLEVAKNRARDIINNFSITDKFQVISNDFNVGSSRYYGPDKAIEKIDEIEVSAASKALQQVLNWQKSNSPNTNLERFILSDFQKTIADFLPDSKLDNNTYLVPLPLNLEENLSIDSCWFSSPTLATKEKITLNAIIKNYSKEAAAENVLTLYVNDKVKSTSSFEIAPLSSKEIELSFKLDKEGYSSGYLSISQDIRTFDDKLYFTFNTANRSKVLTINGNTGNKFIKTLYSSNEQIEYKEVSMNGVDYSKIKTYDLVVLNECSNVSNALLSACNELTEEGGNILLIPSQDGSNKAFTNFGFSLKEKNNGKVRFGDVALKTPFFAGVFEQFKKQNYDAFTTQYFNLSGGNSLFGLANGKQYVNMKTSNKGFAFATAAPFQMTWTDFPTFDFFVPFMLRATNYGKNSEQLFQTIGTNSFFKVKLPNTDFERLILKNKNQEFIPETKFSREGLLLRANENIKSDGIFQMKKAGEETTLAQIAFNYNRMESEIEGISPDALKEMGFQNVLSANPEKFESTLKQNSKGKPYWKYCILLTLLFLGFEILIIKLMKT